MITNRQTGTNIHEIVDGIYRNHSPVRLPAGSFKFDVTIRTLLCGDL